MITLATLFLIAALICFLIATFPVSSRVNLVALGLAFVVLAMLIGGLPVRLPVR